MRSHCSTKRTSTKNNNLKDPDSFKKNLQAQNEIENRLTLRVRSRTSVLALARKERDHLTSFSQAIRTTLRWSRLILISGGSERESGSGKFDGEETQRTKTALCLSSGGCFPEKWRSKHAGCTEAAIFAET